MLQSMTGFGRSSVEMLQGEWVFEIQTVNRKYLEINLFLPKEKVRYEKEIRKKVGSVISRGQVTLRLQFFPKESIPDDYLPSPKLLNDLKMRWERLARDAGFANVEIDLPFVMLHLPSREKVYEPPKGEEDLLFRCIDQGLKELICMRQEEGRVLTQEFELRLRHLLNLITEIERLVPEVSDCMKKRLYEKIKSYQDSLELDERLRVEVALFADKTDVTEEIVRLRSHIAQFQAILKNNEGPAGRKMEFWVQEMGREINTIGSKSADARMSSFVVSLKSELEKIREQVYNIE